MHATLVTARLEIAPFELRDAPFVRRLLNEPSYLAFIGDMAVRTDEDARGYLERGPLASYAQHGYGLCRVSLLADGAPIGMCGLVRRVGLEGPDIGFAFLAAAHGQGYALEAARAVLAHARDELGIARVVAVTSNENVRSQRLLEKLGLRFEQVLQLVPSGAESRLYVPAPESVLANEVRLRPIEPSDLPELFAHQLDPAARHAVAFTRTDSLDRASFDAHWTWIAAQLDITARAVLHRERLAGNVSTFLRDGEREVSYWIDRACWGRGVATRALALLLEEVSERPVHARVATDNLGSLRVLEKNGFVRYGTDRAFAHGRGAEVEEYLLRLDD